MAPEEIIQRRVARELRPGTLVNLGIGLPTGVSKFIEDAAPTSSSRKRHCRHGRRRRKAWRTRS